MRVKRGIQLRRCKLCGKTGHNSVRCDKNAAILKSKNSAKISANNELLNSAKAAPVKTSQIVLVKHHSTVKHSPHVVDLKQKSEASENVWGKIKAFAEKPVIKEERKVVDFAEIIRRHREQQKSVLKGQNIERSQDRNKVERSFDIRNLHSTRAHAEGKLVTYTQIKSYIKILNNYLLLVKEKLYNGFRKINKFKFQVSSFKFQINYRKLAYASIILFILASLPFPALSYYQEVKNDSARVVAQSTSAFQSLKSSMTAALQINLLQAQTDLNSALSAFGNANEILEKEHRGLIYAASLLPVIGKQVSGRQDLLLAGQQVALGNAYLLKGISETESASSSPLTDRLEILTDHLQAAIPEYNQALTELAKIDGNILPENYQKSFADFKLLYASFVNDLNSLVELSRSLNLVFGSEQPKRYLLIFQNNSELRPAGGFVGSFAIMDVQKGKIMDLHIPGGGAYDLQGQLDQYVKPPLPLQLVNARWEFQDANWFPDFPASAQKMAWFYQHSRGATVDGVIALNASVLERLLKILGPVKSDNFNLEILSGNALATLQKQVEVDYDKTVNQPKAVLADLAPQFFEKFKTIGAANAFALLGELQEALWQKEIQVYFIDANLEKHFKEFGWTGEIAPTATNQDYLFVVNANLNGQKSDAKIQQKVDHQAVVQADGTILDTVIIERTHIGAPGEMFYGVNNVSYVRVYAPQGAELLNAGGFNFPPEDFFHVPEAWYKDDVDLAHWERETGIDSKTGTRVTEEFGKTAFGNWLMVAPGQTSRAYFTYRLPFKINALSAKETLCSDILSKCELNNIKQFLIGKDKEVAKYSLLAQKQSGLISDFSMRVIFPNGWQPVWQADDSLSLATNGAEYSGQLQSDKMFGLVMEKNN